MSAMPKLRVGLKVVVRGRQYVVASWDSGSVEFEGRVVNIDGKAHTFIPCMKREDWDSMEAAHVSDYAKTVGG